MSLGHAAIIFEGFHIHTETIVLYSMCKILSLVPSAKLPARENWDKLNVYFQFLSNNIYIYTKKEKENPYDTWQFKKNNVLVNSIIRKLKSKQFQPTAKANWSTSWFRWCCHSILYIFHCLKLKNCIFRAWWKVPT